MAETKGIYNAILAVMAGIGYIGKDQTNKQQGFKYRGVDDVMNALQPLLVENGIFVVPEVLEQRREERVTKTGTNLLYSICTIKYTFYAQDGSSVWAIVIGEGMDSGDKASNKAMSVAYKYACFQVFSIPTEELKDPDADTPEPSRKAAPKGGGKLDDKPKLPVCPVCNKLVKPGTRKDGTQMTAEEVLAEYGKCAACLKKEANS